MVQGSARPVSRTHHIHGVDLSESRIDRQALGAISAPIQIVHQRRRVGVIDQPSLPMGLPSDLAHARNVIRIGRVFEAGKDWLDHLLQVDERHMAPNGATKLLVPVKEGIPGGTGIRPTAEILAVENTVTVGISHHEIADVEPFSGAHVSHGCRRVVVFAVTIVGVNMVFA